MRGLQNIILLGPDLMSKNRNIEYLIFIENYSEYYL